jgi:hypothetical protein
MSTKDLIDKYVKEICPTCKNKKCNLCNITIHEDRNKREANCDNYEKES